MAARERLIESDAVRRLRERDASLFSSDLDQRIPIMQRLGWTDLAEKATGRIPLLTALADSIVTEGATDILLLGMGGSSLAALVMERIIGRGPGFPRLHVLDTTSPVQVTELLRSLAPETTYVVVASKSGTTIEPLSLYAVVRAWFERSGLEKPAIGRRVIVITDPGSPLEKLRQRDMLRTTMTAPATVGGRYSALSLFGLTPAALIGVHLPSLVLRAQAMEAACTAPVDENPAALLAAWMTDAWETGRDKLTFVTSERYASFGLWAEQLVAESLGKDGVGIVPVIEPTPTDAGAYGPDRAFVVLRFGDDTRTADWSRAMAAVHPVFELTVTDVFDVGAEFVRWEHAVALAGVLLGVNPFDERSVTEAKQATSAILEGGSSEVPAATADLGGTWITCAGGLTCTSPSSRMEAIRAALDALAPSDYLALLVYAPDDPERLEPLADACTAVSHRTGHAVCMELGPRYLHSTGQLHKGGPNTGVFILVTARDRADVEVPGKPFGLAALHRAQAEGDLVTLARHGRRVLRLDLPTTDPAALAALADELTAAASR
ncbi:MAG: glucose-6-phosphate isomerase [Coriobacteriia bacterium]|nr:glucose-6-phosphate isomerase [Coriobacteriia bacterium]MBN2839785.1 glucose-6-phosphate isomerase [Coriobacteriia bacterium]